MHVFLVFGRVYIRLEHGRRIDSRYRCGSYVRVTFPDHVRLLYLIIYLFVIGAGINHGPSVARQWSATSVCFACGFKRLSRYS